MHSYKTLPDRRLIRNIIFDFGGVLFDVDYQAPVKAFQALGGDKFEEAYSKFSQSGLFDRLECGQMAADEFVATIRRDYCPGATYDQVVAAWNSILLGITPDYAQLVHGLKTNFRLFIFSNTNEIHVRAFEAMIDETVGLEWFKSAFEKVYYSNEIGMKKPNPDTFAAVCRWHQLDPWETLFIDDSIQHVQGAEKAGLHVYHLDAEHESTPELLADWK